MKYQKVLAAASLISRYAIDLPAQARSPIEKGAKARLIAVRAPRRWAVSVSSSGPGASQHSGLNPKASGKYVLQGVLTDGNLRARWDDVAVGDEGLPPAAAEAGSFSCKAGARADGDRRIVSSMMARRYLAAGELQALADVAPGGEGRVIQCRTRSSRLGSF